MRERASNMEVTAFCNLIVEVTYHPSTILFVSSHTHSEEKIHVFALAAHILKGEDTQGRVPVGRDYWEKHMIQSQYVIYSRQPKRWILLFFSAFHCCRSSERLSKSSEVTQLIDGGTRTQTQICFYNHSLESAWFREVSTVK